jgi:alpha-D-ribose 1-methylphosphonate 5-phosphate C-P lyase
MRGPPDLKCERAALQGSPISHSDNPCIEESSEAISDFQAEKLRRLYSFCRATAYTIASLAFAGCPR